MGRKAHCFSAPSEDAAMHNTHHAVQGLKPRAGSVLHVPAGLIHELRSRTLDHAQLAAGKPSLGVCRTARSRRLATISWFRISNTGFRRPFSWTFDSGPCPLSLCHFPITCAISCGRLVLARLKTKATYASVASSSEHSRYFRPLPRRLISSAISLQLGRGKQISFWVYEEDTTSIGLIDNSRS